MGAGAPKRVLVVVHHLAMDGVSWRILLEDVETAYRQLGAGEPVRLPPKTTSFKAWAERLVTEAASPALAQEVAFWSQDAPPERLPRDKPRGENTLASTRVVAASLSEEETRLLLQEAPRAYRTQINDVLLTAL